MEPLSLAVSILPLIDASYSLCELISDVKDGGKERMKLLNEVTNLCCTLDTLKERFDESEAGASTLSTNLSKVDGPIQQCHDIIASLEQKLTSSKNVAGRFVQQLKWNFDKRDVLQAVEQLHRIQATITQAVQQAMFTVVEQIQHHQTKTLGLVEEKQSKEIRDWLSPLNFIVQQKAIYDSHCDGTGSTFIESKEFENFKKLADSVLWCRGPPGAGKTYLSSITTHHLQQEKECKERQDIVLIVYCRYDDPACQIVTNILGDLLKQCLLRQQIPGQIPESLLNLRKTHMLSDTKPSCEELVTILAELIRRYRRCRIVIDALDEFGEHNDRTSLLKALVLIRHKLRQGEAAVSAGSAGLTHLPEQCCISLLIMSRHIQDIRLALRTTWLDYDAGESPSTNCTYSSHELSPIQEDVRLYIDWRINNDPSLKTVTAKQVGLKDEVLASIVQGSSSMFLLAKLMVDDISACLTVKELKASLQKMPTGLKFAYDATIQRIRAQGEGRSRRAFEVMKWVMLAKRPLASAEIEHAVSIEIGSKDIDLDDLVSAVDLATLCAGLIIVDQNDRFRFSHQTVSEYLSTNHGYASEDQRKSVADCCITYLMYDTFSKGPCSDLAEFRDRLSRYPLYVYSSCYWYRQMDGGPTADQKTIALRFFSSEAHWRSARQAARSGQTKDEEMLPHARLWGDVVLHHAAYLNAHHIFEDLYDMDRSALNRRNELGRTPLMRAAVARSLQFAKKLIDVGADINLVDNAGDTALHIAAWKRDLPMINLILSTSSVELEQGIKVRSSLRTAIFQAADNHDFEIMQRLILRGAAAADAAILTLYESPRGHSQSLDACNIEDLLSCFQDVPYGDYVAFEYRLKDHQDLLDTDPSAHMLLCGALRDLRDGNTSQAQKLVQLSFIVRECGLLAPLDREAFFKSLRASHKDILGRINVDFGVIMKSFSVAVQLYGALHESSYQKDEASSNVIKDEGTGGAVLPPASPRDKMGYMWEVPESPFLAPWRGDFLLVDEEQFSGDEQGQISLSDKGHQCLENPSDATIPQSHRRRDSPGPTLDSRESTKRRPRARRTTMIKNRDSIPSIGPVRNRRRGFDF